MILRSNEVPNTFSKWEVNKPVAEEAAGVNASKLRPIELIIGFVFNTAKLKINPLIGMNYEIKH
jgi:hypothetical protein